MKLETKNRILELLSSNSAQRPEVLATQLKILPQALPRHLKILTENK